MIKDLKFAFKCMKYAYNKKMLSGMSVMFILLGALQFSIGRPLNYITGGMMLVVAPSLFCQMYQTVNMSNLVVSSPKKQEMHVRILTILNVLAVLIGFSLFTIAIYIKYLVKECPIDSIGYLFVVEGVMDIIVLIYMAVSYKHYIISSIIFFVAFMAGYAGAIYFAGDNFTKVIIPIPLGMSIGLVCIIIGAFVFYGISKLVYKSPVDKRAMQSYLRGEN